MHPQEKNFSWLAGTTLLGLMLLLSSCSGTPEVVSADVTGPDLVWPSAPEVARIAYLQSVTRPGDVGIRPSGLVRFSRWLTGSEKGNERLVKPFGVFVDEEGGLLLTDTGANAVCFYSRADRKWRRWQKAGKTVFSSPVAAAKSGPVIYVADSGLRSVVAMDISGKLLFQITEGLSRPCGVVISGGRIVVADSDRHCLVVFDQNGRFIKVIGQRGTGAGEFNFPTHVAVDRAGSILVTDSMNSRVQVLDPGGTPIRSFGGLGDSPGQFSRPKGIAVDGAGNIYVIDAMFDNVQIFDSTGRFLLHFGEAGANPGEFWLPNGIAISRDNEIYVADSYNRRVQVFKYIGPT